jgi:hypothetical protein
MICYPQLLALSAELDVQPALQALGALEMSEEQVRQLVYEFPLFLGEVREVGAWNRGMASAQQGSARML